LSPITGGDCGALRACETYEGAVVGRVADPPDQAGTRAYIRDGQKLASCAVMAQHHGETHVYAFRRDLGAVAQHDRQLVGCSREQLEAAA